jgi:hypothetical protein
MEAFRRLSAKVPFVPALRFVNQMPETDLGLETTRKQLVITDANYIPGQNVMFCSERMAGTLLPDEIEALLCHEVGHLNHNQLLEKRDKIKELFLKACEEVFQSQSHQNTVLETDIVKHPSVQKFYQQYAELCTRIERDADSFAIAHGYGPALASALHKLFVAEARITSPNINLTVEQISDYLEQIRNKVPLSYLNAGATSETFNERYNRLQTLKPQDVASDNDHSHTKKIFANRAKDLGMQL